MIPDTVKAPIPADDAQKEKLYFGKFTKAQLQEKFKKWKQECFDQRWVFERQWMRNLWYVLNRQWIYYDTRRNQWQDRRLAKWVPKPVDNVCKEVVDAIRANFTSIDIGTTVRPVGDDAMSVTTANVGDKYIPVLHKDHQMDEVFKEVDFWLPVTGVAAIHTCLEYNRSYGTNDIGHETCATCGNSYPMNEIADAGQQCPECGGQQFTPTMDEATGQQKVTQAPKAKAKTYCLSPFEFAFPMTYTRFEDLPILIQMRWREKYYYEQHPELSKLVPSLQWGKTPNDRTMQIFKSLPFQNDLGMNPAYFAGSGGANSQSEGIPEYDVWIKPCEDFPQGAVIRFAGDGGEEILEIPSENLPGPFPYTDADGKPFFPFEFAQYDHVGGRIYASSALEPIIADQDILNQTWSMVLMSLMRTSNPIWLEPKGAEVERFTGEPGLVVKYNWLAGGGAAKPERLEGTPINASYWQVISLIKQRIEEKTGTFDILKGAKPAGVEAFSALSLIKEAGQSRFSSVYKQRGKLYASWAKFALELERAYGDDVRKQAVASPNRGWAFEQFKKADLSGNVEVLIEDGTMAPKTSLGRRAAIEHLRQLGLINPSDPDQTYQIYAEFGLTTLLPSIDAQVQEAKMLFEKFEESAADPIAMQQAAMSGQSPLQYWPWYNPQIFRNELIKWAVSDRGRNLFAKLPATRQVVQAFLSQIDLAIAQNAAGILDASGIPVALPGSPGSVDATSPGTPPSQPASSSGGAAQAMASSNRNSAGAGPGNSSSAGGGEPTGQAT